MKERKKNKNKKKRRRKERKKERKKENEERSNISVNVTPRFERQAAISQWERADEAHPSFDRRLYPTVHNHFPFGDLSPAPDGRPFYMSALAYKVSLDKPAGCPCTVVNKPCARTVVEIDAQAPRVCAVASVSSNTRCTVCSQLI